MKTTSTSRVRSWRNKNREHIRLYDRNRKREDRILYKKLFGITHKERLRKISR